MSATHPTQILGVYKTAEVTRALVLAGDRRAGYELVDTIHDATGDQHRDPRPLELERLPGAEALAIARDYLALARAAQRPLVIAR